MGEREEQRKKNIKKVTHQIPLVTNYQINWIRKRGKAGAEDVGDTGGKNMEKLLTHHIQFEW